MRGSRTWCSTWEGRRISERHKNLSNPQRGIQVPSQNTNQTHERRGKLLRKYLSSDEWEDVHLAGVGVFHRRDDEAGAAQRDLTLRPAVHRQRQLPFAHVEHAGKLHALRAAHAARLTWKERERDTKRELR